MLRYDIKRVACLMAAMAASLRRLGGVATRLPPLAPLVGLDSSRRLSHVAWDVVSEVEAREEASPAGRSSCRVLLSGEEAYFSPPCECGGQSAAPGVKAWVETLRLQGCTWSSFSLRYDVGLGFGARGFASKAKKSSGKTGSDAGGGQALEVAHPSAKETATRLMDAALDSVSTELSKLRTGRASPGMLDHVTVMSHGVRSPLAHVAAVSMPNMETLTVMPYDQSMVKEVQKAILGSPLKLNPIAEGGTLRVPIPKLTKEHCQSMVKLVGKAGETAKLSIRRARKDAMDLLGKGSGYAKDEVKKYEKEVEDVTKKYVKLVDESCKQKEKEILGNS